MKAAAAFQPLTSPSIQARLSTKTFGRSLHLLDETSSTNSVAAALAESGAAHGATIVAEAQSAGRGRWGRRWHSPHGKNLYCSIILRPTLPSSDLPLCLSWIPLLSAVAVARTMQVVAGLRPMVKWPNDVHIGPRKIAGLLCESSGAGASNVVVVIGIGINVNTRPEDFPQELQELATSMAIETGHPFDRRSVLGALLSELEIRYDALTSGSFNDVIAEYRVRCSTIGQRVRVSLAGTEALEGLVDTVTEEGSLRIRRDQPSAGLQEGALVEIRSGEVVHVRENNVKR